MKRVKIQWKPDAVALAALILSIIAAVSQFYSWARGPNVKLIVPDRVALYSDVAPDGSIFVRVAAHMSYANIAQAPYGNLVLKERAQLRVGRLTSQQQWNAFGTITRGGVTMTELAAPQPLPGQSAVSHFTLFTPITVMCPEGANDCKPKQHYFEFGYLAQQVRTADRLHLQFEIELIEGRRLRTACYVPLSLETRRELVKVRSSYSYLRCYSVENEG